MFPSVQACSHCEQIDQAMQLHDWTLVLHEEQSLLQVLTSQAAQDLRALEIFQHHHWFKKKFRLTVCFCCLFWLEFIKNCLSSILRQVRTKCILNVLLWRRDIFNKRFSRVCSLYPSSPLVNLKHWKAPTRDPGL